MGRRSGFRRARRRQHGGIQILVRYGQGGFAEQLAGEAGAVGDGAAAQVDEVAAEGQVAVHVDVGVVHGQRGPVLGNLGRRPAAQQALGAGAGGDVGTTTHCGGAEGRLVSGHGERPVDGVVQAPAAALDVRGHGVQCGQQLICGEAQVKRHDAGMSEPVREGRRCGTSSCRSPRRWRGWRDGRSSS